MSLIKTKAKIKDTITLELIPSKKDKSVQNPPKPDTRVKNELPKQ